MKEGRQANYFSAAHPQERKVVPGHTSWKQQIKNEAFRDKGAPLEWRIMRILRAPEASTVRRMRGPQVPVHTGTFCAHGGLQHATPHHTHTPRPQRHTHATQQQPPQQHTVTGTDRDKERQCGQTLNNDGLLSVWSNDEDCLAYVKDAYFLNRRDGLDSRTELLINCHQT